MSGSVVTTKKNWTPDWTPVMDPETGNQSGSKREFKFYQEKYLVACAEFMNRDPDSDLWVFRRFEKLHLFNILCIQERLAKLENDFEGPSWKESPEEADKLRVDIQRTLEEYDNALAALVKFKSYRRPGAHILDYMCDWSTEDEKPPHIWNRLGLIRGEGSLYNDDLASIGSAEKSWIHRFIDEHHWLRRLFEKRRHGTGDNSTLIYFEANVRRAETFLIHGSFWVLLFCPLIVLSYLPNDKSWKLLVVAAFLLAASVLSASLLNAPNTSGLALVAGYAAILVVFVTTNAGQ